MLFATKNNALRQSIQDHCICVREETYIVLRINKSRQKQCRTTGRPAFAGRQVQRWSTWLCSPD